MALFRRQPDEAERILLQSSPPLIHRAIKLNLSLYRWTRALDLALKYKTHVDTVLGYRQRHLDEFGKIEKNAKFLQYSGEVIKLNYRDFIFVCLFCILSNVSFLIYAPLFMYTLIHLYFCLSS